jgi:D-glycerate 3-kinase
MPEREPGWIESLRRAERLPESYVGSAVEYVAPLAERIRALHRDLGRPVIVGINGAQGSGKSTLALFLSHWLRREIGLAAACLSIDDIYLTRAERETLARDLHPLFVTRGVPGTHETGLGERVLDALTAAGPSRTVSLPAFDKGSDDRLPEARWPRVEAPVDVVLFEGWCVGARPEDPANLTVPINDLEAKDDADAVWRHAVNERLRSDYARLFGRLDLLVMLRIPSFEKVLEWRGLQEQKLRERSRRSDGLTDAELRRFIRHYERLTRHMLVTMPAYADVVIDIDSQHGMAGVTYRD